MKARWSLIMLLPSAFSFTLLCATQFVFGAGRVLTLPVLIQRTIIVDNRYAIVGLDTFMRSMSGR